ncbi:MAG TPA: aromatic ring-hydroxylating dioxygenase subunit alpha [Acidimicrobiia bacterium]|nr:aromatic ring-hydroxylating dioxygenase subunit alpha [Acidimicrobiia bacterium]
MTRVSEGRRRATDGPPGPTIQDLLDEEDVPVPGTLRLESSVDLGTHDIPRHRYFSRAWHDLEVERLWKRVWQVACREEDIPEAGDTLVYDIADSSLVLVRGPGGVIRAFHNSCLHRGRQLRTEAGCVAELRCPFHGFTWDLTGRLRSMPSPWDFPHVDPDEFCLPEARVDTWGGWVFVNLDPAAAPLERFLGDFVDHWKVWPMEERAKTLHVVKYLPCNWKVALEAFLESYHVITTHPQLLVNLGDANTEYDTYEGQPHFNRMISAQAVASPHLGDLVTEQDIFDSLVGRKTGEPPTIELRDGQRARRLVADKVRARLSQAAGREIVCTDSEALDGIQYQVFPNFVPWGGWNQINYRFRPNGADPETSILDVMMLSPFPAGNRPPAARPIVLGFDDRWTDVAELGRLGVIFEQDMSNLGPVQRGLHASVKPGVTLGNYQESRIRHYHRTLESYLEA